MCLWVSQLSLQLQNRFNQDGTFNKKAPPLQQGPTHNNCLTFRSIPNCNVSMIFKHFQYKLVLLQKNNKC